MKQRKDLENDKFTSLQKDKDYNSQVYVVNHVWINNWIKFIFNNEKMPGPIDNSSLQIKLVVEDNADRLRKNANYYLLSK